MGEKPAFVFVLLRSLCSSHCDTFVCTNANLGNSSLLMRYIKLCKKKKDQKHEIWTCAVFSLEYADRYNNSDSKQHPTLFRSMLTLKPNKGVAIIECHRLISCLVKVNNTPLTSIQYAAAAEMLGVHLICSKSRWMEAGQNFGFSPPT